MHQILFGFANAEEIKGLEAFLRRVKKAGFYFQNYSWYSLCASADRNLITILCVAFVLILIT